jgi:anti-sigma regulatory factor (Ser/Thr protein kinase)
LHLVDDLAALPRSIEAPGVARRWLVESFAEELDVSAREKARSLVSELVTDAVVHGRGRIVIRVQLDRERLLSK